MALGRAIAMEPAAFLLDEPLTNLDAALQVEMRTEIKLIQRKLATTMIFVTHDSGRGAHAGRQDRGDEGRRDAAGSRGA